MTLSAEQCGQSALHPRSYAVVMIKIITYVAGKMMKLKFAEPLAQ